jgi:hypothetical protein
VLASLLALLLTYTVQTTYAQSLADVARREAERRKQVTPGRVITDEDLVAVDAASPPPPTDAPASTALPDSPAKPPAKDPSENGLNGESAGIQGRPKRDEQYWRGRSKELRARLAKTETDAAGAESRLAKLDGGAQTSATARERKLVAAMHAKLKANGGFLRDELAAFERRARAENVPVEWTR